jgi:pyrroloquinoline quinone (PQQ) biosynthesis protein C
MQVVVSQKKVSRRQNHPQISKQIATSHNFASLRYLQETAIGHHGNELFTSRISEGK